MVSKWQYIAEMLNGDGQHELAKKALEIEGHLKEIYGNTVSPLFTSDYEQNKLNKDVYKVAMRGGYCVACNKSLGMCTNCKYGNLYGMCDDITSEFRKFVNMW